MRAVQTWIRMTGRLQRSVLGTVAVILVMSAVLFTGPSAGAGPPSAEELEKLKLVVFSSPVKAPDFVLKNLQGEEVRLDSYQGKPLLLYFWATW